MIFIWAHAHIKQFSVVCNNKKLQDRADAQTLNTMDTLKILDTPRII